MGHITSYGQSGRLADFDKDAYQPAYVAPDEGVKLAATLSRLESENAKLRELATCMAQALGIDSEWCDTSWCDTDCMVEFGCQPACCGGETRCPAWARLRELGVVK